MPLQFETSNGPLVVSEQQIRAVTRHAERQADLTAATLNAMGFFPKKPAGFPAAFLLELGAVLELGLWERQGLRPYFDVDLPTYREAADALLARAQRGPAAFDGPDAALLSSRVLQTWMNHFAWEGQDLLQADVLVGGVDDEDTFVDLLANFLLTHRHALSTVLSSQGKYHEAT
jgi:hypothetical protein